MTDDIARLIRVSALAAVLCTSVGSCVNDDGDKDSNTDSEIPPTTAATTSEPTASGTDGSPTITIAWGEVGASGLGSCGRPDLGCRWIDGTIEGFEPSSPVTLACTDEVDGTFFEFQIETDGDGSASWDGAEIRNCLYGVPGEEVWLAVDGIESNRLLYEHAE